MEISSYVCYSKYVIYGVIPTFSHNLYLIRMPYCSNPNYTVDYLVMHNITMHKIW